MFCSILILLVFGSKGGQAEFIITWLYLCNLGGKARELLMQCSFGQKVSSPLGGSVSLPQKLLLMFISFWELPAGKRIKKDIRRYKTVYRSCYSPGFWNQSIWVLNPVSVTYWLCNHEQITEFFMLQFPQLQNNYPNTLLWGWNHKIYAEHWLWVEGHAICWQSNPQWLKMQSSLKKGSLQM